MHAVHITRARQLLMSSNTIDESPPLVGSGQNSNIGKGMQVNVGKETHKQAAAYS